MSINGVIAIAIGEPIMAGNLNYLKILAIWVNLIEGIGTVILGLAPFG